MIQRVSLRSQVLEEIRQRILDGRIPAGTSIRETQLAEDLGVSRTPIREALQRLEEEGLVALDPGRGFSTEVLTAREAQELYPLRALLEPLALRLSGLPDAETLAELKRLNQALTRTRIGATWIDLDDRWHDLLIAGCENRHLMGMIAQLRRLTRRYEHAFFDASAEEPTMSTRQHHRILELLEQGDLDEASDLLADNMLVGVEAVLRWLQEQELPATT